MGIQMLRLDLDVRLSVGFKFHQSTIWPSVNTLAQEVDEIDAAADAAIALLMKKAATAEKP